MDLRKRLARLSSPAATTVEQPVPAAAPPADGATREERLAWLRSRLQAMSARSVRPKVRVRRAVPEPTGLPGRRCETEHGPVHAIVQRLDASHRHGDAPVAAALQADAATLAELALDPALARIDPTRMLFFDTETTGLSGGTGTLAFLVGMAWFDSGALWLEQLLLTRPTDEAPMLRHVADRLASASALVTYNGKAFDLPLLRSRFILSRLGMPISVPHLDLLHCARRVLKHRLASCRLTEVESEFLGFGRVGDIDGADIPSLYWEYLRSGDGHILEPIVEHNANDVIGLAALAGRIATGFARTSPDDDPLVRFGFAEHAARIKDSDRAARFARAAAAACDAVFLGAMRLLATVERRRGDPRAAADALQKALGGAEAGSAEAAAIHLGLAKLYEHRLRDPERALAHARRTRGAEEEPERRIARLERRVARQAEKAARGQRRRRRPRA